MRIFKDIIFVKQQGKATEQKKVIKILIRMDLEGVDNLSGPYIQ